MDMGEHRLKVIHPKTQHIMEDSDMEDLQVMLGEEEDSTVELLVYMGLEVAQATLVTHS